MSRLLQYVKLVMLTAVVSVLGAPSASAAEELAAGFGDIDGPRGSVLVTGQLRIGQEFTAQRSGPVTRIGIAMVGDSYPESLVELDVYPAPDGALPDLLAVSPIASAALGVPWSPYASEWRFGGASSSEALVEGRQYVLVARSSASSQFAWAFQQTSLDRYKNWTPDLGWYGSGTPTADGTIYRVYVVVPELPEQMIDGLIADVARAFADGQLDAGLGERLDEQARELQSVRHGRREEGGSQRSRRGDQPGRGRPARSLRTSQPTGSRR